MLALLPLLLLLLLDWTNRSRCVAGRSQWLVDHPIQGLRRHRQGKEMEMAKRVEREEE